MDHIEDIAKEITRMIASEFQIPQHMILGPCNLTMENQDARRYYNRLNATHKGTKRRARRMRAYVSKMIRRHQCS